MDQKIYDTGMKMRRQVAGNEYVDKAQAGMNDFNRDFQRIVTQYAHGELVVLLCRGYAVRDAVVVLVANVADLATGEVEFALGTHLVLAQFVDDGDWKLQVHGWIRCVGVALDGRAKIIG